VRNEVGDGGRGNIGLDYAGINVRLSQQKE